MGSLGYSLMPHTAHTQPFGWDNAAPDPTTLGDKQGKLRARPSQEAEPKGPSGENFSSEAGFH